MPSESVIVISTPAIPASAKSSLLVSSDTFPLIVPNVSSIKLLSVSSSPGVTVTGILLSTATSVSPASPSSLLSSSLTLPVPASSTVVTV